MTSFYFIALVYTIICIFGPKCFSYAVNLTNKVNNNNSSLRMFPIGIFPDYDQRLLSAGFIDITEDDEEHSFNFNGTKLKAIILRSKDLIKLLPLIIRNGSLQFGYGWEIFIINDLIAMMNFSIDLRHESSFCIDESRKFGCLRGINDEVIRGRVDMTIGLLYIFKNRLEHLTAIHSFTNTMIQVMYYQPKNDKFRRVYTKPFKSEAWITLLVILILVNIAKIIVLRLERITHRESRCKYDDISFREASHRSASLLNRSVWNGQSFSIQTIAFSILFLFLVLWVYYCANFISILTNKKPLISSLQGLKEYEYQFKMKPGILSGSMYDLVRNFGFAATIVQQTPGLPVINGSYWLDTVRGKQSAYIAPDDDLIVDRLRQNISVETFCGMSQLSLIKIRTSHMFVKKGSPLREGFNVGSLKILNIGLISRNAKMIRRYLKVKCPTGNMFNFENVKIYDLLEAFLILTAAALLALGIALMENCIVLGKSVFQE